MSRPLRVAIVGSGPAGVYASDALMKSGREVSIDLYEKMPAPFGLIRYGVAPDHPRIKGIIRSLHRVLDKPEVRLIANVEFGKDITLDEMKELYDAVVFATGAVGDRDLDVPGADLEGHHGAGEFVGFYDGNPLFKRDWDLSAESVAVVGVGNVGLDVARILAKTGDELHVTEIPDNVYESLRTNKAREVHVFGRRGPAQAKFTPLEIRELGQADDVDIVVYPEDFEFDEGSMEAIRTSNQVKQVTKTLTDFTLREDTGAKRRLHLHFLEAPVEIVGDEETGVTALRTERQELDGSGGVNGTGKTTDWPMDAVYRAVGYFGTKLPELPFDERRGVITNIEGRVIDGESMATAQAEDHIPGLYTTGWIKRGPVGLIGHTKGDALETIGHIIEDFEAGRLPQPAKPEEDAIVDLLADKGIDYIDWEGYHRIEAAEKAAGEPHGRERIKLATREAMVEAAKKMA